MAPSPTVSASMRILELVKKKTTTQQFATWFRNLSVREITDQTVVLEVPSSFHRDWILMYYREILEDAVGQVVDGEAELQLVVARDRLPKTSPRTRYVADPPSAPRPVARAPPRDTPRMPAEGLDFEHFVVGPSNQLAKAAGLSLSRSTNADFTSMLVVGGTGLGKTHVLQAIRQDAMGQHDRSADTVAYIRAESFVNDFVQALADGDCPRFRERYRNLDFVCFDDLQVLVDKGLSQQEFLHTYTAWLDRGARVAMAARCAPGELLDLEASLLAQIRSAFWVTLKLPDAEMRRHIVEQKARARGEELPDEVTHFLADLPVSNVRELEGAVTSIIASSRLQGVGITLGSARLALQGDALVHRPTSSPVRILDAVCTQFGVRQKDIVSSRRPQALSFARQVAMYLLRERTALSLSEIGDFLGGRDHTTVLHGIRKIERSVESDRRLQDHLSRLRTILDQP